jgi:hypothetical protein
MTFILRSNCDIDRLGVVELMDETCGRGNSSIAPTTGSSDRNDRLSYLDSATPSIESALTFDRQANTFLNYDRCQFSKICTKNSDR